MEDDSDYVLGVPAGVFVVAGVFVAALIAILVALVITVVSGAAQAHDDAAMKDPKRAQWFESLKQPGNGAGCCNLTDCRQTKAEQMPDGHWRAVLTDYKGSHWIDVPPERVLKKPLSIDGEAYICNSSGAAASTQYEPSTHQSYSGGAYEATLYCFIPPIPGF